MRSEDDARNFGTHFSDVWADAQRSRTAIIRSYVMKIFQRARDKQQHDRTATVTHLKTTD
jgi:hypothetical protein